MTRRIQSVILRSARGSLLAVAAVAALLLLVGRWCPGAVGVERWSVHPDNVRCRRADVAWQGGLIGLTMMREWYSGEKYARARVAVEADPGCSFGAILGSTGKGGPGPHALGHTSSGGAWKGYDYDTHTLALPDWVITLAAGAWPVATLIRRRYDRRRAQRLARGGECPTCGYDLRATPDRCPECGAVPPPRPSPPAANG